MRKFNRFQAGSSVYTCSICERQTRETGDGVNHLCHQCFEISGLDNMVNDSGEDCPTDVLAQCNRYLAEIVAKGGNGERVKDSNTYIWSKNNSDEPVAIVEQVADVEPIEVVQPQKPRSKKMSKRTLSKAQKTVNLVAKFDGKIKPGDLVAKIQSMCKFNTERAARTYLHNARKAIKAGKAKVTPARKKKAVADQVA
jgi:hypothetical protein